MSLISLNYILNKIITRQNDIWCVYCCHKLYVHSRFIYITEWDVHLCFKMKEPFVFIVSVLVLVWYTCIIDCINIKKIWRLNLLENCILSETKLESIYKQNNVLYISISSSSFALKNQFVAFHNCCFLVHNFSWSFASLTLVWITRNVPKIMSFHLLRQKIV